MKSFNRGSVAAATATPEHNSYRGNRNVNRQRTRYRQNRSDSFRSDRSDHSRHGRNRSEWTPDDKHGHEDLVGYYFRMHGAGREVAFKETKEKIAKWAVTEYDKGGDLYDLVMNRQDTTYDDPEELTGNKRDSEKRDYEEDKRKAYKNREMLKHDKLALIMIMEGQCEPVLQDHLRDMEQPKNMATCIKEKDVLAVIDAIQGFVLGTTLEKKVHKPWNQQRVTRSLFETMLSDPTAFDKHCNRWKAQRQALHSVTHANFPFGDASSTDPTVAKQAERYYAALFLSSLNGHFQPSINKLHRDYRKDPTVFPDTVLGAINLIKDENDIVEQRGAFGNGGVARRPSTQYSHQQMDFVDYDYDDEPSFESEQHEPDDHHDVGIFHQGEPFYPLPDDMDRKPRAKSSKKKKKKHSNTRVAWSDSDQSRLDAFNHAQAFQLDD